MVVSAAEFFKRLLASGVVPSDECESYRRCAMEQQITPDAERIAADLVKTKNLTPYQAKTLLEDHGHALTFDDYLILDLIGEGGMGQVYKACHRRLKRIVALKVLRPSDRDDDQAIRRFEREMEAVAKLSHPNIVVAHDAGWQQGVHYLVMEFVAGQDLKELVCERGPLPVEVAVSFVLQAARGLAYAHAQGVIHRDMKPANLLVDDLGNIKILDLGLARLSTRVFNDSDDGLTASGMLMGTVDYMAPEQALDTKTADARSDVYSLGCTFFYLLSGKRLYDGDTVSKRLLAHREDPIPALSVFRPDAPSALVRVFERMIAKCPSERFQSMEEVADAIIACGDAAVGVASTVAVGALPHQVPIAGAPRSTDSRVVESLAQRSQTSDDSSTHAGGSNTARRPASVRHPKTKNVGVYGIPSRYALPIFLMVGTVGALGLSAIIIPRLLKTIVPMGDAVANNHLGGPTKDGQSTPGVPVGVDPAETKSRTLVDDYWEPDMPEGDLTVLPTPGALQAPFTPAWAGDKQEEWSAYLGRNVVESVDGIKLALIPPGQFQMGTSKSDIERVLKTDPSVEPGYFDFEAPCLAVRITRPFWLGVHEVTQEELGRVLGRTPSHFCATGAGKAKVNGLNTARFPVENVTWYDAAEFCNKLSERAGLPEYYRFANVEREGGRIKNAAVTEMRGVGFRLPSEAEWEYACRAGTTTSYSFGDSLNGGKANVDGNYPFGTIEWGKSLQRTAEVSSYGANSFGLFDMHGNVSEWCQDWLDRKLHESIRGPVAVNPLASKPQDSRVIRGGSWQGVAFASRSAVRAGAKPIEFHEYLGFRVARTVY